MRSCTGGRSTPGDPRHPAAHGSAPRWTPATPQAGNLHRYTLRHSPQRLRYADAELRQRRRVCSRPGRAIQSCRRARHRLALLAVRLLVVT